MKLVSIIIPYFKKKILIDKTLESIHSQIYNNYEIIIIYDDNDKDELKYLIQKTKKNKKIRILVNKKNMGAGASRNKAIKIAKGEYIAFIDADDIWKKNKLKKQMSFMIKNNYDISHTSYEIINDKDVVIGKRIAKNLDIKELLKSCDIGLSTVVIKKKMLKKFRFAKLKTKEDYVLWLRLAKNGNTFYGLNQSLSLWRLSKNSLSSSIIRKLIDGYRVYRFYLNQNVVRSFLSLINLSINYLKKNA
jgi:teichuronic acid biosynthesis glycosyltransferase TuaG